MKTKILICALAAATLAVAASACGGSKKSSNGAPAFADPPGNPATTQIDRMGRPTINTVIHKVLDTTGALSDAFNGLQPSQDVGVAGGTNGALAQIVGLLHACPAPAVAGALLPDVLTLDTTVPANYALLNGRALADDVFDDTLVAIYSSAGGFCSGAAPFVTGGDHVDANDVAFSTTFPFLAAPH